MLGSNITDFVPFVVVIVPDAFIPPIPLTVKPPAPLTVNPPAPLNVLAVNVPVVVIFPAVSVPEAFISPVVLIFVGLNVPTFSVPDAFIFPAVLIFAPVIVPKKDVIFPFVDITLFAYTELVPIISAPINVPDVTKLPLTLSYVILFAPFNCFPSGEYNITFELASRLFIFTVPINKPEEVSPILTLPINDIYYK